MPAINPVAAYSRALFSASPGAAVALHTNHDMPGKYEQLNREELIRLLEARDRREPFGLVWEANEIEREAALNNDFVALDLDEKLSCGAAPWRNLIIEGDNFDALRHLRMAFSGRVKCIYIDPPYNTGNRDFVYNDSFVDREDSWRHSKWCEFMFQRLMLSRALLREDGVIFVSIDDNEVAALRLIMDKVFGPANFLATLVWEKGKKGDSKFFSVTHEYVVVFAQSKDTLISTNASFRRKKPGVDEVLAKYNTLRESLGDDHNAIRTAIMAWYRSLPKDHPARNHKHYNWSDGRGLYFAADFAGPDDGRENRPRYDILHPITGEPCKKPSTGWRWEEERTLRALAETPPRIHFGPDETTIPCRKSYLHEIDSEPYPSVFYRDGRAATLEVEKLLGKGAFSFPKNTDVICDLIRLSTEPGDLVCDFFAGSGTTAHAVLNVNREDSGNRRFILVSSTEAMPEEPDKNLCRDVCASRVRRVIEGSKASADEVLAGLGGDFAYLRTQRVPAVNLLDMDHAQIWTALQLAHRDTVAPFKSAPFVWAGDEDSAVCYVPRFDKRHVAALRKKVKESAAVTMYSWQPQVLKQHVRAGCVEHLHASETLTRWFGFKLGARAV